MGSRFQGPGWSSASPQTPWSPLGSPSVGWTLLSTHWEVLAPSSLSRPQSLQALSLLLPLTHFLHPSSGLLPSPWALTRAPPGPPCLHSQPLPSWPQRGLSTPAHSPPWLPSAPRTEPQPLSLACEAMPLCSPHSPVSPTQPFCHPKLVAATEPRHQHQMLSGVPGTQDELRECLPTRRFSSCCLPLPLPAQLH